MCTGNDRERRIGVLKTAMRAFFQGLLVCLGLAWMGPGLALAQGNSAGPDPFAGVEEMIVTGSSAADLLNPTSTSTIAFDASELSDIGAEDIGDLAAYVPNLEIATVNATNASFFVRGVGLQDFGANASSSVPIFQDGIPRNASATQLVGLFDIGGLSVLKGPQGSGNFRNASAGAFVVQTNLPEPEFSGTARMTVAKIASVDARDANRYSFETAMNAPIYGDVISARIAARYSHENPFWENRCANRVPFEDRPTQPQVGASVGICGEQVRAGATSLVTPFLHRYLGEVDDYGLRGTIRIKPEDAPIDWTFRVELSNLNRDSTTGQHIGTGAGFIGQGDVLNYRDLDLVNRQNFLLNDLRAKDPSLTLVQARQRSREILEKEIYKDPLDRGPYAGALNQHGRTILETHAASTTAVIDSEVAQTTINLGFLDYRKSEGRDTDLSPNQRFGSVASDQSWQLYGDLSVEGDAIGDVPVEWDTGVYTIMEKLEAQTEQTLTELSNGGTLNNTDFTQEIYGFGLFAQASYDIIEVFTLSGGLRYNWERKDFDVRNVATTQVTPPFGGPVLVQRPESSDNQRTWDSVTGFVNLEYRFTEDITTYLKYTRGFKAGHFNPSDATAAKVAGEGFADPESLDSVEWGLNGSFFSSRLLTTASIFFYNYRDYQVFRLTTNFQGVSRVVQNADQARNFGAEVELNMKPIEGLVPEAIEGLRVTLRGGWLEAQFVEFSVLEPRLIGASSVGIPIDYSGNSLLNSPNLQASALFAWPVVLEAFGTVTPQYDFTWTDDTPFDPNNGKGEPRVDGTDRFQPYSLGNRAYMLHNVRLSWTPPGDSGLELSGWCRNVTDVRYKTFAVDLSTFSTQQLAYVADPRVCGADFRFTW